MNGDEANALCCLGTSTTIVPVGTCEIGDGRVQNSFATSWFAPCVGSIVHESMEPDCSLKGQSGIGCLEQ